MDLADRVAALEQTVKALSARLDAVEASPAPRARSSASTTSSLGVGSAPSWTEPYSVASPDIGETWIEMHEPSARRQLHKVIVDTVRVEGPVTEGLALRRAREAWGVKRAGARIQTVFDQAIRQLISLGQVERKAGVLVSPAASTDGITVRVPTDDPETRRAADEIPSVEIGRALELACKDLGSPTRDELTSSVAKLFGWTRRGTEIQNTLDANLQRLIDQGRLAVDGDRVRVETVSAQ